MCIHSLLSKRGRKFGSKTPMNTYLLYFVYFYNSLYGHRFLGESEKMGFKWYVFDLDGLNRSCQHRTKVNDCPLTISSVFVMNY